MATSHHGEERSNELMQRFLDEANGKAIREFPHGRAAADDDGVTTYAMATDVRHALIRIQFPRPTTWIGLDITAADELIEQLSERLLELRGITA